MQSHCFVLFRIFVESHVVESVIRLLNDEIVEIMTVRQVEGILRFGVDGVAPDKDRTDHVRMMQVDLFAKSEFREMINDRLKLFSDACETDIPVCAILTETWSDAAILREQKS